MDERRKYRRIPEQIKTICKVMGEEGELELHTLDVSGGGIRLPLRNKLKQGTLLELNLVLPGANQAFFVLGKVVWQSRDPIKDTKGVHYLTGVEFTQLGLSSRMQIIHHIYKHIKSKTKEKHGIGSE